MSPSQRVGLIDDLSKFRAHGTVPAWFANLGEELSIRVGELARDKKYHEAIDLAFPDEARPTHRTKKVAVRKVSSKKKTRRKKGD